MVAEGRPAKIAATPGSYTGQFLKRYYTSSNGKLEAAEPDEPFDLRASSFPLLSAVEGSAFYSAERLGDHEPEAASARPKPAKSVPRKPTAAKKAAKMKSYSRRKKTVLP